MLKRKSSKTKISQIIEKILLIAILLPGLTLSSFAIQKTQTANAATGVNVTILQYSDGEMATADSVNHTSFPMSATWEATNIGAGTGEYTLDENSDIPYQAMTVQMDSGANYSTNEILSRDMVGASCDEGKPFALSGYTMGDTKEEAAASEPSMTIPAFTNITSNKTVIVWNIKCPVVPTSAKVTITAFVQGSKATSDTAASASFPMSATWATTNIGAGTGTYQLDSTGDNPYVAVTADMNIGSNYSTNEMVDGDVVGSSCDAGRPFALIGYTSGDTYDEALNAEVTTTMPALTNLQNDKFIIVWNQDCNATGGEISGDVSGSNGTLAVTSIDSVDTQAMADGTFENGWQYAFNITVPNDQTYLAMKFSNWARNGGNGSIAVANNIRISSSQADNNGDTVMLTSENTYSTPTLHITGDLNPDMAGKQVRVLVEVAVPNTTPDGSYTTSYGVKTTQ